MVYYPVGVVGPGPTEDRSQEDFLLPRAAHLET